MEPCAICESQGSLIRIEVRDEDGPSRWFGVCSEECLYEISLRWTQVCEIVYPE